MQNHVKRYLLVFLALSAVPAGAQDKLVISAMANTGATQPVSEILQQAYDEAGIEIKLHEMPGKRGLHYAQTGATDGEAYRVAGIERSYPDLIRVDVPIRTENMHFYVKKGNEFEVKGWDNTPEHKVLGYLRGTYFVERAADQYGIQIQPSSSYENLIRQLNSDRNDVIIMGTKGAKLLKTLNIKGVVKLEPPALSFNLYHYLHKRNLHLVPRVERALQQMHETGQIDRINSRH